MFDLEYYNEITDYGNFKKEINEKLRTQYQKPAINTKKINIERDKWFNYIEQFTNKHKGYSAWFMTYDNKVIKKQKLYTDEYYDNLDNRLNKL
jgi:hypothetical protein